MAKTTRLVKSLSRLIFPAILLVVAAFAGAAAWLTYKAAHPPTARYVVTPEKYGQLSSRGAQVTEETWPDRDGTTSRGWLLKGNENSPGIILFHKYGADRSYELNLGVKLNEATNFTILMPDLRAHGVDPPVQRSSFGGCESEDALAAVEFLRGLKTQNQIALVGKNIGVYGVELGAIAALETASKDHSVTAIALDSAPADSDQLLSQIVRKRYPFASVITSKIATLGTYLYFYDGCYRRTPMCETAHQVENRNILLLAGIDEPDYQEATMRLAKCLPANNKITTKFDLSPSGIPIINASMEQSEAYDERVIDFFRMALTD